MSSYSLGSEFGGLDPRFEYVLQRVENLTNVANGGVIQPLVKSGISVPPVSQLKVVSGTALGTENTKVILRFMEPTRLLPLVSNYNVYVKYLNDSNEWQLIATAKRSPAEFYLLPASAGMKVALAVQTELRNGQRIDIKLCPTTSLELT
jgi:hypothetical protein